MNDINASSVTNWITHGWNESKVNITIDGNGKKVDGLKIEKNEGYLGFIGVLGKDGIIKNLHLRNVKVKEKGNNYVGGIAGVNYGKILGCSVSGTIKNTGRDSGGIAGVNNGEIIGCYNMANVSANGKRDNSYYGVGGIAGRLDEGTVIACYNVGIITRAEDSDLYLGSICGGTLSGKIEYCYWNTSETEVKGGMKDNYTATVEKGNNRITDGDWSDAMEKMNKQISGYKYIKNGNDSTEPLVIVTTN